MSVSDWSGYDERRRNRDAFHEDSPYEEDWSDEEVTEYPDFQSTNTELNRYQGIRRESYSFYSGSSRTSPYHSAPTTDSLYAGYSDFEDALTFTPDVALRGTLGFRPLPAYFTLLAAGRPDSLYDNYSDFEDFPDTPVSRRRTTQYDSPPAREVFDINSPYSRLTDSIEVLESDVGSAPSIGSIVSETPGFLSLRTLQGNVTHRRRLSWNETTNGDPNGLIEESTYHTNEDGTLTRDLGSYQREGPITYYCRHCDKVHTLVSPFPAHKRVTRLGTKVVQLTRGEQISLPSLERIWDPEYATETDYLNRPPEPELPPEEPYERRYYEFNGEIRYSNVYRCKWFTEPDNDDSSIDGRTD